MPVGGGSIQVMRIFGIRIGVSASWFVVLFLMILLLSRTEHYIVAVGAALLFYVSLVLHELGHALVARRQGIDVQRIDLWFFGGLAQLSREPRSPGAEFAVAIAGPVVTLLVGIACGLGATLIEAHTSFLDAITLQGPKGASAGYDLLSFVAVMNIVLFVFNLAPGFPLDGGRIVFAAAWKLTGDRNRGMRIAGRGGVAFAYLLGGLGLYLLLRGAVGDGLWFLAIAYLLQPAARAAIAQGTMRHRLLTVTVAEVMDPHPVTIDGETTLLEARERVFEHQDWPFVGVVDGENRFLGVLTRDMVDAELAAGRPALTAREVADGDRMDWLIRTDQQLEDLLQHPTLAVPGAVFAVDREDFLRGVVTAEQVRRAITVAPGR